MLSKIFGESLTPLGKSRWIEYHSSGGWLTLLTIPCNPHLWRWYPSDQVRAEYYVTYYDIYRPSSPK